MATIYYNGGKNDMATAATFYVGGVAPADGDSLLFADGGPIVAPPWNGLNSLTGVDLLLLQATRGFRSDLGAAGNYVEITLDRTNTGVLNWQGSGSLWIKGGTTKKLNKIIWDPSAPATLNLSDYTTQNALEMFAGDVRVPNNVVAGTVQQYGGRYYAETHGSNTLGACEFVKGYAEIRRRLAAAANIYAGMHVVYDVDTTTTTSQSFNLRGGQLTVLKGSVVVNGYSGVLDLSKLERPGYQHTILDTPLLIERHGPILPTFVRSSVGRGATIETAA